MLLLLAALLAVFVLPDPWGVVAIFAAGVVEVAEIWFWLRWSRRRRPAVGIETMIGRPATVAIPCRPRGQVRIDGEIWTAVCAEGADGGDPVFVVGVETDGLTLRVAPTTR
jgi:membrane protein implicated in regulation of membrane protease activity